MGAVLADRPLRDVLLDYFSPVRRARGARAVCALVSVNGSEYRRARVERSELGRTGEAIAARYLERRGWRVVDRNVRYREGEIDIVAARDGVLAFVEVKTRRSRRFGTPGEAVTRAKAARIRRLAAHYLAERRPHAANVRFDVLELAGAGDAYRVTHLENCF